MMRLGALVWLLAVTGLAGAQTEPWTVIFRYPDHRKCSPAVRAQIAGEIERQLRGQTPAAVPIALADAAGKPQWQAIFDAGLDKLDRNCPPHAGKWHFVRIELAQGSVDHPTSPTRWRHRLVQPVHPARPHSDVAGIVRASVSALLADAGPTAQIVQYDATGAVQLRPSVLAPAGPWTIAVGDALACSALGDAGPTQVPAALIRIQQVQGDLISGQLYHRFQQPLRGWPDVKVAAVRLRGESGPVRIRAYDEFGQLHGALEVRTGTTGFGEGDAERERGLIANGHYESRERYDGIAFAELYRGTQLLAQVPILIGSAPTDCQIRLQADGELAQRRQFELDALRRRSNDLLARANGQQEQLRAYLTGRENSRALQYVRDARAQLVREVKACQEQYDRLPKGGSNSAVADALDEDVKALLRWQAKLAERWLDTQKELESTLAQESGPEATAQRQAVLALLQRAEQEQESADYDKALATYEAILREHGERPEVRRKLDALREAWKPTSDEHRLAREWIYALATTVRDAEAIGPQLPTAKLKLDICKRVNDRLTPRRLYLEEIRFADLLTRRRAELTGSPVDRDQLELRQIDQSIPTLQQLMKDTEAACR